MNPTLYSELQVSEGILKAVEHMGFTEMTEIQQKAIPLLLAGRDVLAQAPTGTGKTAAFGIPLIEACDARATVPQILVICPTRELAIQNGQQLQLLSAYMPGMRTIVVYGGQPISLQIQQMRKKPQIIVATPGRILDHLKRRTIRLNQIKAVVLDEADEMLNMGFLEDVRDILDRLPEERQVSLFSATLSRDVLKIASEYQHDAEHLQVLPKEANKPKIRQFSLQSSGSKKMQDLLKLMQLKHYKKAMVFCNTKRMTDMVCDQLQEAGYRAEAIHGDIRQVGRNRIMAKFKAGAYDILVATDVAARGLDIQDVDAVFNYDMPQDNAFYLHRIGRTGRAQKEGTSYLFVTPNERHRLRDIMIETDSQITPLEAGENGEMREVPVRVPYNSNNRNNNGAKNDGAAARRKPGAAPDFKKSYSNNGAKPRSAAAGNGEKPTRDARPATGDNKRNYNAPRGDKPAYKGGEKGGYKGNRAPQKDGGRPSGNR